MKSEEAQTVTRKYKVESSHFSNGIKNKEIFDVSKIKFKILFCVQDSTRLKLRYRSKQQKSLVP